MVETLDSCLLQQKNFNPKTKRCIETEESCRRKGKNFNVTTKRCNNKKKSPTKKKKTKIRSNSSPEKCSICLDNLDFKSKKKNI